MTYNVFGGTLSLTQSINQSINHRRRRCLRRHRRRCRHHHTTYTHCSVYLVSTQHYCVHRTQRPRAASYPYKEVEREENVEDEIDLLRCTFCPFLARLHCFSAQCPVTTRSTHLFVTYNLFTADTLCHLVTAISELLTFSECDVAAVL